MSLLGIDPSLLAAGLLVLLAVLLIIIARARRLPVLELVLILSLVGGAVFFFGFERPILSSLPLGLDLRGGTVLTLQAVDTPESPVTDERLQTAVDQMNERVDRLGIAEAEISLRPAEGRIDVALPSVSREQAMDIVQVAYLTFKDAEGNLILTGEDLIRAQERLDQDGGAGYIHLELSSDAKRRFAEATTRVFNGQSASCQIYIYLDDYLIQAPSVQSPNIEDPIIQGYESLAEARRVATILNIGALPLRLDVIEVREVSATLGAESLARSETAALIGIAAVALFMIAFYRGAGLVANIALAVYALVVLGALSRLGASLTLPGIAGLVLGVGIAVDANVIIFERIKDHLQMGRTLRAAVESGYRSALRTVVDANLTTLIVCAVLFYFGDTKMRGFAVTLGVSIIASMATAVVFSQYVLKTLVDSGVIRRASVLFGQREAKPNVAR